MGKATPEQLLTRLDRLRPTAVPFAGVVFRSSTPRYATEAGLLTGEGSRRTGGRWNPRGVAVVYASFSPETAMAETLAHNRYFGVPIEDAMPRTFVAIDINLQAVLDLRLGEVRRRLRVSAARVLTVDWRAEARAGREPITQLLGRAAHAGGWEGLIVPSAADSGGHNLLAFPGNLAPASSLSVRNAAALGGS